MQELVEIIKAFPLTDKPTAATVTADELANAMFDWWGIFIYVSPLSFLQINNLSYNGFYFKQFIISRGTCSFGYSNK